MDRDRETDRDRKTGRHRDRQRRRKTETQTAKKVWREKLSRRPGIVNVIKNVSESPPE